LASSFDSAGRPIVLLTGATGYIGGRLLKGLEKAGWPVRCLARHPEFLPPRVAPSTEVVMGDGLDQTSLPPAMAGLHTAYYLVHSMGSSGKFEEQDRQSAVAVESCLSTLRKDDGTALADGSKKKIRDLMHLLYEHAIRYEWTDRNPITSVRQSGVRQATPIRLSVDQLSQLIYGELKQRERVMVLLDFGTGLRRGELSGVRWEDICFEDKVLIPKRSIVKQRIGKVKTEASKKSIPLDDVLIEEVLAWRQETPYAHDSDYVFASTKMRGKQPYWMSRIMQHPIKPVAAKNGIEIKGWHTLRHSCTTLLRQNNNNPKVVQGLLRHASYAITMNVYDEAMSEEKRNAHRGVIQQLNRSVTRSAPKPAIPQVIDKVGVPDGI